MPLPYGGKFRQIMVDLNPEALYAKQLSPADVSNALGLQNLIYPAGTAKIGDHDYQVKLNSSPRVLDQIEQPSRPCDQRRADLHEGHRAGARRLRGADLHRAHERNQGRAADRPAQRQGIHLWPW